MIVMNSPSWRSLNFPMNSGGFYIYFLLHVTYEQVGNELKKVLFFVLSFVLISYHMYIVNLIF